MPAEIATLVEGGVKIQALVFPNYVADLAAYDLDKDTPDALMIYCDQRDTSSKIHLFPRPVDMMSGENPNRLLPYCDDDNLLREIDHGESFYIKISSVYGQATELVISHSLIMSPS